MDKFYLKPNHDLEGWDIIEVNGIQTEEGSENSIVATFYEKERAFLYCTILNNGNCI